MANKAEGKKYLVDGTPTCVINLSRYLVSLDEADIKQSIEDEIKKAKKK